MAHYEYEGTVISFSSDDPIGVCADLVHWVEGNKPGWLEKQAPVLRSMYQEARIALRRAAQLNMQAIGGPQVEEKSSESQAANA